MTRDGIFVVYAVEVVVDPDTERGDTAPWLSLTYDSPAEDNPADDPSVT